MDSPTPTSALILSAFIAFQLRPMIYFFQRGLQYSPVVWLTAYYSGSISKCMLHRCQAAGCVKEAANATKCANIVTLTWQEMKDVDSCPPGPFIMSIWKHVFQDQTWLNFFFFFYLRVRACLLHCVKVSQVCIFPCISFPRIKKKHFCVLCCVGWGGRLKMYHITSVVP